MFDKETRADKPRRALPASRRRSSNSVLVALLRRGAAVVVVSGIGLAGIATFTASATTAAGTAYAAQTPLGISSIDTGLGGDLQSAATLADQRNQSLSNQNEQIASTYDDSAFAQRHQALGKKAVAIADEDARLKDLARFQWPTAGEVGSVFGMRLHPILHYYRMHDGDDIGGNCGQPIWAAQSGTVTKAAMGYNGGAGNNVWIDNGKINGVDVASGYLHMSRYVVNVGQKVSKGDVIGYVGSTGLSTACHLHFSIKKNGVQSDPMEYIGWNPEGQRAAKSN